MIVNPLKAPFVRVKRAALHTNKPGIEYAKADLNDAWRHKRGAAAVVEAGVERIMHYSLNALQICAGK